MNRLASELNDTLSGSVARELLSDFGERFYFPRGIISQSAEAKQHAHRFNATIGMAFREGQPLFLPSVQSFFHNLSPEEVYPYAPTSGVPELRAMWKELIAQKNPRVSGKRYSLPVVVPGLTAGISVLADLFVNRGGTVVVPDMFWGNYRLIFEGRREATLATFPFFDGDRFNLDGLERTIRSHASDGKAAVILNFPNNPTGYSPTKDEAARIRNTLLDLATEGLKILVVLDDAYFGLFYEEDANKQSLFADLADAHENLLAVKVDGATKEDFTWGFRTGFLTFSAKGMSDAAYDALVSKVTGAVRASVSSSSRPAQSVLLHAMRVGSYAQEKEEAFTVLKERYQTVRRLLAETEFPRGMRVLPFNSGYFMAFELEHGGAEKLRQKLLRENGIGVISIEDRFIRVAFASVDNADLPALYNEVIAAAAELT